MSAILEYDVVVLGGGSAGTSAAKTAHEAGARVVMFNRGELGGLCILRGCMPTKTMLHAAHLRHEAAHHQTPGIGRAELDVDFAAVMRNKDAKVARFKAAKLASIERAGYEVVDAHARFVAEDMVEADGRRYRFRKGAVIATGSVPSTPDIQGLADVPYWTSDDIMDLTAGPRSCVVVGSGAIGLELAQFLARLGTQTVLASRRPVFQDVDPLIVAEMEGALRSQPRIELLTPWQPLRVSRQADGRIAVDLSGPRASRTIVTDALLLATGRRAAIDDLGLDAVGVHLDAAGRLVRGPDMSTDHPRVFVAGDASNDRQLLHVANWEGRVAGLGAAQVPGEHRVEQRLHMEVVFTDPPMAKVGMTEVEALQAGIEVATASARLAETGRAITMDVMHGAMKLVGAAGTGEILGFQMLGPRADDVVHAVAAIMFYRGTAAQMLHMPWYHPTITEVLLQLARQIATKCE